MECLARIDVHALQPRLTPAAHMAVAQIARNARELRDLFDRDRPVDLHDAVRAAHVAKTDGEFSRSMNIVKREVVRYTSKAARVARGTERLRRDLAYLEELGASIWAESLQLQSTETR